MKNSEKRNENFTRQHDVEQIEANKAEDKIFQDLSSVIEVI